MVHHHVLPGQNARRMLLKVAVRKVQASVLRLGDDMRAEFLELVGIFLDLEIQALGAVQIAQALHPER